MQVFGEHRSEADNFVCCIEDRDDWFIGPCSTNRDAGVMTRANYKALLKCLEEVDPNGNDHEEHRFSHWGVGWVDVVLIKPESPAFTKAYDIESGLSDYPLIDDDSYYEEQDEQATKNWNYSSIKERINQINEYNRNENENENVSIFAARRDEYPSGMSSYLCEYS